MVDVVNKLPVETTTMHWHGQYMHGDIEGEEGKNINMKYLRD